MFVLPNVTGEPRSLALTTGSAYSLSMLNCRQNLTLAAMRYFGSITAQRAMLSSARLINAPDYENNGSDTGPDSAFGRLLERSLLQQSDNKQNRKRAEQHDKESPKPKRGLHKNFAERYR
jgi:hypothetical protein